MCIGKFTKGVSVCVLGRITPQHVFTWCCYIRVICFDLVWYLWYYGIISGSLEHLTADLGSNHPCAPPALDVVDHAPVVLDLSDDRLLGGRQAVDLGLVGADGGGEEDGGASRPTLFRVGEHRNLGLQNGVLLLQRPRLKGGEKKKSR